MTATDAESYSWWHAESQNQQLLAERIKLFDRIISYVKEHGFNTTTAIAAASYKTLNGPGFAAVTFWIRAHCNVVRNP